MSATLSWLQAQRVNYISLWVATLALGVYAAIFFAALQLLLTRQHATQGAKYLLAVTVLLFILALVQIVLNFAATLFSAFGDPANPDPSTVNLDNIFATVDNFLTVTTNLVADCLLAWRCYIIWGRKPAVITVPTLFIVVGTVAGYTYSGYSVQSYLLAQVGIEGYPSPSVTVFNELSREQDLENVLTTVFYAMTFASNVVMTGLIVGRIWWLHRNFRESAAGIDTRLYANLVTLFVESGGIHSTLLLLSMATVSSSSIGVYEAYAIVSSLAIITAGLSPTLIIVLLALGRTANPTAAAAQTTMAFAAPPRVRSESAGEFRVSVSDREVVDVEVTGVRMISLGKEDGGIHGSGASRV
ncbi:hypothetical protein OE88DRAFT_568658 [Heliocybe sulcata]|uniref:Uncharacterized protein n=1 Tax=Heliocybe sulcata TaxID=5364 RepID=A0A5C3MTE0_9AGAM|nr:hypothetical protein OE88DRAFT_568658 [Heliocybe sulcata]